MNQTTAARDTLFSCDPAQLEWLPWAIPGASFKLLHADADSGRFSLLIKIEADVDAPMHRHVGAVEGMVLEGSFHYHDQPELHYTPGTYLLEKDGAVHKPISPQGAVMFAVFHGPVEGLDDAGNVIGRIDWKWHADTWALGQRRRRRHGQRIA